MRVSNSHSTLQSSVPLDVPLDIFVEWAPPAVAPTRHPTRHIYFNPWFLWPKLAQTCKLVGFCLSPLDRFICALPPQPRAKQVHLHTECAGCVQAQRMIQWPYRALWTLKKCSIRIFSGARYPNAIVERRLWKDCQVSLLVKLRSHRKNHVSITRKRQSALGHYKGTASPSSCKNY